MSDESFSVYGCVVEDFTAKTILCRSDSVLKSELTGLFEKVCDKKCKKQIFILK